MFKKLKRHYGGGKIDRRYSRTSKVNPIDVIVSFLRSRPDGTGTIRIVNRVGGFQYEKDRVFDRDNYYLRNEFFKYSDLISFCRGLLLDPKADFVVYKKASSVVVFHNS